MNTLQDETSCVIQAAGGIVERRAASGTEIAIIHRTRYGDEWCLPKGKLKEKESWQDSALREVKEETGFDCAIKDFAGATSYLAKAIPKVVLFWRMDRVGGEFRPSDEVDDLNWVSPLVAMSRLTHSDERTLVGQAYPETWRARPSGLVKGSVHRVWRAVSIRRRRWRRLASDIEVYKHELKCYLKSAADPQRDYDACLGTMLTLIAGAEAALDEDDIDKGWKFFHAARRAEIPLLRKEARDNRVSILRNEAEKLRAWRKRAVENLLGSKESPKTVEDNLIVYEAAFIRDEHYDNQAYKASLRRGQFVQLAITLALVLGAIYWVFYCNTELLEGEQASDSAKMLLITALFGLLGGVVSSILKALDIDQSSRIPEMIMTIWVTLLRIFVGAASAVVIYVFLRSQITDVVDADIVNDLPGLTHYTVYAISFAAGFSERLVLRAVAAVGGEKK